LRDVKASLLNGVGPFYRTDVAYCTTVTSAVLLVYAAKVHVRRLGLSVPPLSLVLGEKMAFRSFPFNFHDGQLTDFSVGPRQEVTLHIALDPVWNQKQERTVLVRFGAIQNFDVVSAFFEKIERPTDRDRAIVEVIGLLHSGDRKDAVIVDLSPYGSVEIKSRHVTVV
jgi:hypothetical protein